MRVRKLQDVEVELYEAKRSFRHNQNSRRQSRVSARQYGFVFTVQVQWLFDRAKLTFSSQVWQLNDSSCRNLSFVIRPTARPPYFTSTGSTVVGPMRAPAATGPPAASTGRERVLTTHLRRSARRTRRLEADTAMFTDFATALCLADAGAR